ncbi:MAG: hypothetical protein EOO40_06990 [Deltaproteobacteria bacterium]|nr:MAG: hypothetical protein EOO40_06990 [Deltaproteobacteria bacterium]
MTIVRHRLTTLNRTTTLHPIRSHILHRRLSNSSSNSNRSILRLTTLSSSNSSRNITNSSNRNNRNSTTLDIRRRQVLP